jgi:hypothetical protein
MPTLTSSSTFTIADKSSLLAAADFQIFPSVSYPNGNGRLVHPTLGAYDYEQKPLQWLNLDGDVLIAPTWAGTKTLGGAAVSLWKGNLADVVCEERWTGAGGLAMPVAQLRALLAFFTNPVDPAVAYVQWFPNYTSPAGFNVILADLLAGSVGPSSVAKLTGLGRLAVALDDAVNYGAGFVRVPVTLYLKLVSRI